MLFVSLSCTSATCHNNDILLNLLKGNQVSYKNQLQIYIQKQGRSLPTYYCVCHAHQFKATVKVDEQTFESTSYCKTVKEAEQSAAKVALVSLFSDQQVQGFSLVSIIIFLLLTIGSDSLICSFIFCRMIVLCTRIYCWN